MSYLVAPARYEAQGFVVRQYDVNDGPLLTEAVNESYEHLRTWMPWAKPDQQLDESNMLVRQFLARTLLAEDFVIGVFAEDETRLLGGSGFHMREGSVASGSAEIGMWIRASEAHRGLGVRVLGAMLRWGFTAWPWQRLAWRCDQRNVASMRVAEKNKMRLEGVLVGQQAEVGDDRRNTVCYGLTRQEFQAS
jgi:RimJ/RimL family protein N-acetyltransferase